MMANPRGVVLLCHKRTSLRYKNLQMADIFDKCDDFWARMKKVAGEHFDPALATFFRKFPTTNCVPIVQVEGQEYLQIATNDYLGLATHPEVIKAGTEAASVNGLGTPLGARPLTGNTEAHLALEAELTTFRKTEAALVFNLGLGAISGTIACMVGRKERVILGALFCWGYRYHCFFHVA